LPWVRITTKGIEHDNFEPLTSLSWQAHVYGQAKSELQTLCSQRNLLLHVFPWNSEMGLAGLQENAAYLVRPDGYVAFADPANNAKAMLSYLEARKLSFRK